MILQRVTFLHEQFRFTSRSNYLANVRTVRGQCLICVTYVLIKIKRCRVIISFGTAPLHPSTIDSLLNDVGVPIANITGVGFVTTACDAPGIPTYQLHIPSIELFNGVPGGVPVEAVNGFYLDLWELQDVALKYC